MATQRRRAGSNGGKSSQPDDQLLLWHPALHEQFAKEQLAFLMVGFGIYRRQHVLSILIKVFADLQIRSYALWEIFGQQDFIIQAWLPMGVRAERLRDAIRATLKKQDPPITLENPLIMNVEEVVHHWMWDTLPDDDFDALQSELKESQFRGINPTSSSAGPIASYREKKYLHEVPVGDGIKFFLRIQAPTNHGPLQDAQDRLASILDTVLTEYGIRNRVVMRVGGDAFFLLTGRVEPSRYEAISELVQEGLGRGHVLEILGTRTTTHISALDKPLLRREQLLPPIGPSETVQEPTSEDVVKWAQGSETAVLEFKSTAFSYLDIGAQGQGARDPNYRRPTTAAMSQVAKAVVGMLNSGGGNVVLGVAEVGEKKFTVQELLAAFPEGEAIGSHVIIGIAHEYGKSRDWDGYSLNLLQSMAKHIEGGAESWVEPYRVDLCKNTVCVLQVRRPSSWFYLIDNSGGAIKHIFYGRNGARTIEFQGRAADSFRDAHPRSSIRD